MPVFYHLVMSDSLRPHGPHQAPLSTEFSRQEYWSRLAFPSPGDLPDPGIESKSLASPALAAGCFTAEPPGKPISSLNYPDKLLTLSAILPPSSHYDLSKTKTHHLNLKDKIVIFICLTPPHIHSLEIEALFCSPLLLAAPRTMPGTE